MERRLILGAVLIAVCAAGLLIHAGSYDYVVDDAYISFRYARNLTEGHGLVFNPGERVEGYTNFLWVILIALGMRMGADPVRLAKALCFAFAVLSMITVYYYYGKMYGRRAWERFLPVGLIAVSPPIAVWALGGLETTMFAFLVTAAILAHIASRGRDGVPLASSMLVGLAALTRPEGMVFAAILFVDMLVKPKRKRHILVWLIPLALMYIPYFTWRYEYYGWLFPNTFYAKTGGGPGQIVRGFAYARDFLLSPGGVVCLLAVVPAAVERSRRTLLPLVSCIVWAGYVVAIGGDGLAMYRFAVPVLPICYRLSAKGLAIVFDRTGLGEATVAKNAIRGVALGICLLLVLSASLGSKERDFVLTDRMLVEGHWIPIGKWLRGYARPDESVAVGMAGAIPYYSRLYTIDMLGITDPHIAHVKMADMGKGVAGHEKYDMRYVLARRPTYIIHYPFRIKEAVITPAQFENEWNPGLAELPDMPGFRADYQAVSEEIGGRRINFFRLKAGVK
jgi:arabinofuranosyltransferase